MEPASDMGPRTCSGRSPFESNSLLTGHPLYGVSLDYQKCFDSVSQDVVLHLAKELGLHERVLRPLQAMYKGLRRRFVFAGAAGSEFLATNGILQGCALSAVLLNALVSVWAKCLEQEVPEAVVDAYADDTGATAQKPKVLQEVLTITGEFAKASGLKLGLDKCSTFATSTSRMHRLVLEGSRLSITHVAKSVGVHIGVNLPDGGERLMRIHDATGLAEHLRFAPLPFDARVKLMDALTLPKGLYECTAAPMTNRDLQKFRNAILRGILGAKRGRMCAEIVFTLFGPGHRIDPQQAVAYRALVTLHRMIHRRPELHQLVGSTWVETCRMPALSDGPLGVVWQAIGFIGATWFSPFKIRLASGEEVDLTKTEAPAWAHTVRDNLRLAVWRQASKRRRDMDGLEEGVDRQATQALLFSTKLPPPHRAVLRQIMAGGVWTQDRACRASMQARDICPFCGEEVEDHAHLWWRCARWADIRESHKTAADAYSELCPPCLQRCGIMPSMLKIVDPEVRSTHPAKLAEPDAVSVDSSGEESTEEQAFPDYSQQPYGETIVDGRVVVYTDGACQNNQFKAIRCAGVGGHWAENHPFNFGEALGDGEQTNNRAELTAVVKVLKLELRPLDVRTDSKYVIDGATKHRFQWRRAGWVSRRRQIANAELWVELDDILESRPAGDVLFTKVKAHCTNKDVQDGVVSKDDFIGNAAADALAVAGSQQSSRKRLPPGEARQHQLRATTIVAVQKMMVDIFLAREAARKGTKRSSDKGGSGEPTSSEDTSRRSSSSSSSSSRSSSSSSAGTQLGVEYIWVESSAAEDEMAPD